MFLGRAGKHILHTEHFQYRGFRSQDACTSPQIAMLLFVGCRKGLAPDLIRPRKLEKFPMLQRLSATILGDSILRWRIVCSREFAPPPQ
jgi:hypothetical protein